MRRAVLLLSTLVAALLVGSGVALAAVIPCPGGLCEGTTGDDEMTGTSGIDYIYAKEGNDTLRGGPGNDDLDGGGGNDQYNIYDNNWGADRISGENSGAKDWLIFQISSGVLTIDLKPSPDRDEASSGTNKIDFASKVVIEWVQAGPDSDTIKGNSANNSLSGAGVNDTLAGVRATTPSSRKTAKRTRSPAVLAATWSMPTRLSIAYRCRTASTS